LFGAPVDFGHQENLVAITIAQRLAHAGFAGAIAIVVIPTVVHESQAAINGRAHDANAFRLILDLADVRAAQADAGNFFAGAAELPQRDFIWSFGRPHTRASCGENAG